jgi:hypothetical protein
MKLINHLNNNNSIRYVRALNLGLKTRLTFFSSLPVPVVDDTIGVSVPVTVTKIKSTK